MKKQSGDRYLHITHGDSDELLAVLEIEPRSRSLIVNPTDSTKIVIAGATVNSMKPKPKRTKSASCWLIRDEMREMDAVNPATKLHYREITGNKVLVMFNSAGREIELPILNTPAPYCPVDDPFEILGQNDMMFSIALAIKLGKHSLLTGPTGIGKTTVYRWIAKKLGWNLVIAPIARGTQDRHLLGEYAPAGPGDFRWMDGPVTAAARLSIDNPTILVFDELNRIGNMAEFSRVYSLLDDTRMLELPEKRQEDDAVEVVKSDMLYIGATANPTDDEGADYIGVKELDPAFNSRFLIQPALKYPKESIEVDALCSRVEGLERSMASRMVKVANRIRSAHEVRFPFSFRELEAWALCLPHFTYEQAAEVAVISKVPAVFRADCRNLLKLHTGDA